MRYTHTHNGISFSHKNKGNHAIRDSMDGPWGNYAKWSKSYTERQILCDIIYM